mgnify:CR=1 FL=1
MIYLTYKYVNVIKGVKMLKYQIIANEIENNIYSNDLPQGTKLPISFREVGFLLEEEIVLVT